MNALMFLNEAAQVVQVNPWVDLASRLGLPAAMLVAFAKYHIDVVRQKDAKLDEIQEKRVAEEKERSRAATAHTEQYNQVMTDVEKTMAVLAERLATLLNSKGRP